MLEEKSTIGTESSLQEITITIGVCIVIALVWFVRSWWTSSSPSEAKLESLRTNAHRLGLNIHHVNGNSLHEVIADQLKFYNPRGTYTCDIIKECVHNGQLPISKTFSRNDILSRRQIRWKKHVAELYAAADAYKRNIEVVHYDGLKNTIIRPSGIGFKAAVQTLYIGYGGNGNFVSLKPVMNLSDEHTEKNGTKDALANTYDPSSNVLIGDNSQQFVIQLPRQDDTNEICMTKNIVIGDGTSQNIIATFRTSRELIEFIKNVQSSGIEGSGHQLKLKICQKSDVLTADELKEKEERIIELLDDDTSDTRRNLEETLKEFSLSFEKATSGCILLHLSAYSMEAVHTFVRRFQDGDLVKMILLLIAKDAKNMKHVSSCIDVQLHLCMKLNASEREKMVNLVASIPEKQAKMTTASEGSNGLSSGISLVLKHNSKRIPVTNLSAKELSEELSRSSLECLGETGLFKDATEIDVRLEPFSSQRARLDGKTSCRLNVLQHASNRIYETVRGYIGLVQCNHGAQGTCFRVGKNYVMTAYHVIEAIIGVDRQFPIVNNRLTDKTIIVEFPDVNKKHQATVAFVDSQLDVAVMRLVDEQSEYKAIKYVKECYPGLPFYTVGYTKLHRKRKAKRSVIVSTDYRTKMSSDMILFQSDTFDYGCSGAPGLAIIDGEARIVTMLLGCIIVKSDVWYYGMKMTEIQKHLQRKCPSLAAEIFQKQYQVNRAINPIPQRHQLCQINKKQTVDFENEKRISCKDLVFIILTVTLYPILTGFYKSLSQQ